MIPTDEQPYPLPDGWQWCRLGDMCNYGRPETVQPSAMKVGKLLIDLEDIEKDSGNLIGRKVFDETNANSSKHFFQRGNVLYGKLRPYLNKVIIADEDGYCSSEILPLDFGEKILNRYAQFFLMSPDFVQYANQNSYGTNMPRLGTRAGQQAPFPLPPLDEQQRIVALLDELFADLDEAKALAQAVVDGSKLRRAAILHKAFTGELSQLWRDEHGTTLDSWQRCLLGDVLISSKQKTTDFSSSDLKYVGLENMEKDGEQISFQAADDVRSTKNVFCVGDLLYGKLRPYLNKHGVTTFDGVCSTDILVFKANAQAEIEFVNYFLSLPKFIEYAVANSKGINLPRVSEKVILRAEIFLPPPEEQKEIVRLLDDLLGREQRTKDHALKTIERVELIKKSILARAFRGELGTN